MEVGKVKSQISMPVSIDQLKKINKKFNETSSIHFYVNTILDQQ